MKTPLTLAQALRQAGDDLDQQPTPVNLQASIMAAVNARLPRPVATKPNRHWAWSGAAATCAVVAAMGVSLLLMLLGPAPQAPLTQSPQARLGAFVPVVPQDQWPADDTPAWLVSTELRRDRLAALGLPFDPSRAGESLRAELLVRPSGQVLAVRFVQ